MDTPFSIEQLQAVLSAEPEAGIVELVDKLLTMSRDYQLELFVADTKCRARAVHDGAVVEFELPWSRAVFRGVLARIAVLSKDPGGDPVSPYGGQGFLNITSDESKVREVEFSNTPQQQRLRLAPTLTKSSGTPRSDCWVQKAREKGDFGIS